MTVDRIPLEDNKVKAAMEALRKKRIKLVDTAAGYQAKLGDSAIVNMRVSLARQGKPTNSSSCCVVGL